MPVLKRYKPIITLNKDEKVTKRLELFSLLNQIKFRLVELTAKLVDGDKESKKRKK